MTDWVTISSLATAGGTLMLAVATFSSVRSSQRTARVAERSLLAGLRSVLVPSREDDPSERVRFGDQQVLRVQFRRQQLDLYIPAGDTGYWLGALRDPSEPIYDIVRRAATSDVGLQVDLLYGDHEGGQRTIVRFMMSEWPMTTSKASACSRCVTGTSIAKTRAEALVPV